MFQAVSGPGDVRVCFFGRVTASVDTAAQPSHDRAAAIPFE